MAPTAENGAISPLCTLDEDTDALASTQTERIRKTSHPILTCFFDLDDTLYPRGAGLASACVKNIEDYMVQKLGFPAAMAGEEAIRLYKEHGTTMAGLRAEGYAFSFDDWHAFTHGRLPYHLLKPDPALRQLLESLPQHKIVFTNADHTHASRCLHMLGLEGCFDTIIAFEDVMEQLPVMPFSQRNVFGVSEAASKSLLPPHLALDSEGTAACHISSGTSSPCIPSSSSAISVPSSALPHTCTDSNGRHDQQEGAAQQQADGEQREQDSKHLGPGGLSPPQVPSFQCTSRRCISVDGLLEHGAVRTLAQRSDAQSRALDGLLEHASAQPLAAATTGTAAGTICRERSPAATEADSEVAAAPSTAAAAVASWEGPAGPLVCCKPQAEAFHRAVVSIAGADPLSSIMFDDSTRNIAAAKKSGMHTVLVGASEASPEADYVLSDIHKMRTSMHVLWQQASRSKVSMEDLLESPPCICHQKQSLGLVLA